MQSSQLNFQFPHPKPRGASLRNLPLWQLQNIRKGDAGEPLRLPFETVIYYNAVFGKMQLPIRAYAFALSLGAPASLCFLKNAMYTMTARTAQAAISPPIWTPPPAKRRPNWVIMSATA